MSQTQNIRLPSLIITEIKDNQIKIKLNISRSNDHMTIFQLFNQIRTEYVGHRDQYDGVYFPLKYLRDKYSGEILEDSDFLILKNQPKSLYYDFDNRKQTSFQTIVDQQKQTPVRILAHVDLTYIHSYGRLFINANITKALVNPPKPHEETEDCIIELI